VRQLGKVQPVAYFMGLYEAIYASDDITVHDVQHEQIVIELSLPGGGGRPSSVTCSL